MQSVTHVIHVPHILYIVYFVLFQGAANISFASGQYARYRDYWYPSDEEQTPLQLRAKRKQTTSRHVVYNLATNVGR